MPETYYDLLGVGPDATADDVAAAYRERLTDVHPDVSDAPDAGERTKRLIAARDVLTDEAERERYDRLGHERYRELHGGGSTGAETDSPPRTWTGESASAADPAGGTAGSASGSRSGGRDPTATSPSDGQDNGNSGGRRNNPYERNTAWRTQADGAYEVGRSRRPLAARLKPSDSSLIVLVGAFLLYPLMLWAAVFPPFPLVVNVVVGICLVGEIAFLQSMPAVGAVVFGAWAVLLPTILVFGLGVPLGSIPVLVAVVGTAFPLGLSVLTGVVLRL